MVWVLWCFHRFASVPSFLSPSLITATLPYCEGDLLLERQFSLMVFGLRVKLIHIAVCTVWEKSENFICAQMRLTSHIDWESPINKNTMFTVVFNVSLFSSCYQCFEPGSLFWLLTLICLFAFILVHQGCSAAGAHWNDAPPLFFHQVRA